jgi:hypothetical protein
MKVGTVLIAKNNTDDMDAGEAFVVKSVSDFHLYTNKEDVGCFTLEPDRNGLSWETFFTVKEL